MHQKGHKALGNFIVYSKAVPAPNMPLHAPARQEPHRICFPPCDFHYLRNAGKLGRDREAQGTLVTAGNIEDGRESLCQFSIIAQSYYICQHLLFATSQRIAPPSLLVLTMSALLHPSARR